MGITVVASIVNTVRYSQYREDLGENCLANEFCLGPLIKFAVWDGLFGTVSALLLIFGARSESNCLLVMWMIMTGACSIKYLWVLIFHEWINYEVQGINC